jgi:hypothetical protein
MTIRSEAMANLQTALEDISTANTYDDAASIYYRTTPARVQAWHLGPEQVDEPRRPFIGFYQNRPLTPSPYPFHMYRPEMPVRINCYCNQRLSKPDQRTQADNLMADVQAALNKDIRLQNRVCFLRIDGVDTTEGSLVERGFVSVDVTLVWHHRKDEL